ncbi:hypothetical protein RRG08_034502 [Elysia crispata]|uniref:Uncharacterized protein n=1 Tax=Elysia crispata TaxID=231223 RepID=A0AAE1BBI1_9GAST|nr:hypothetical protein RRG08_034502 [Elysia crispata]
MKLSAWVGSGAVIGLPAVTTNPLKRGNHYWTLKPDQEPTSLNPSWSRSVGFSTIVSAGGGVRWSSLDAQRGQVDGGKTKDLDRAELDANSGC